MCSPAAAESAHGRSERQEFSGKVCLCEKCFDQYWTSEKKMWFLVQHQAVAYVKEK